jgi:cob(I)alamin adenosyltransferase
MFYNVVQLRTVLVVIPGRRAGKSYLQYLRRIDEHMSRIEETLIEHGERLTTIERMLGTLRREQALDAEARASLEARIDRLAAEVNRIKRFFDLSDAALPILGGRTR